MLYETAILVGEQNTRELVGSAVVVFLAIVPMCGFVPAELPS